MSNTSQKFPRILQRQQLVCALVARKATRCGCNQTDITLGRWTARYWLRRGRSVRQAVELGLAKAHQLMDLRTGNLEPLSDALHGFDVPNNALCTIDALLKSQRR
jgi:hypothetical protein